MPAGPTSLPGTLLHISLTGTRITTYKVIHDIETEGKCMSKIRNKKYGGHSLCPLLYLLLYLFLHKIIAIVTIILKFLLYIIKQALI